VNDYVRVDSSSWILGKSDQNGNCKIYLESCLKLQQWAQLQLFHSGDPNYKKSLERSLKEIFEEWTSENKFQIEDYGKIVYILDYSVFNLVTCEWETYCFLGSEKDPIPKFFNSDEILNYAIDCTTSGIWFHDGVFDNCVVKKTKDINTICKKTSTQMSDMVTLFYGPTSKLHPNMYSNDFEEDFLFFTLFALLVTYGIESEDPELQEEIIREFKSESGKVDYKNLNELEFDIQINKIGTSLLLSEVQCDPAYVNLPIIKSF
jgi:hypothetical protein